MLLFEKDQCHNCKMFFFTLNCLADKIELGAISDVPDDVQLVKNNDYLEKDVKSMLSFYFCFKYTKAHCSVDNPLDSINFRGKNMYD